VQESGQALWVPGDLSMELAWPGEAHMQHWLQNITQAMAEPHLPFSPDSGLPQGCVGQEPPLLAQLPACKGTPSPLSDDMASTSHRATFGM